MAWQLTATYTHKLAKLASSAAQARSTSRPR
jgi:hypothetical protein